MPQIPRYNRQAITEQADNTQERVQYSPDQFGAGLGQSLAQVGDMYGKFKEEADNLRAKDALTKYTRDAQEKQDKVYLNTEKRNAIGVKEAAQKDFDSLKQVYGKDLSPSQRNKFTRMANDQDNTFYSSLNKHEVKQIGAYEDDVYQATIDTQREQATFNATDFGVVNKYIAEQEAEIYARAEKKGLIDPNDPSVLQNVLLSETSKTRRAVLERLIDSQNVMSADEFFSANQDKMTEKDSTAVRKALEEGKLTIQAQEEADRLVRSGSIDQAIKNANQIEDVKLRDETKKRIMQFGQQEAQAESFDQENIYLKGWNLLEANPNVLPKDLVGPAQWSKLSPEKRKALNDFHNSGGAPKESDIDTYYNLQLMAGNKTTRKKFLNTDLRQYQSKLKTAHLHEFMKMQRDYFSGKDVGEKQLDGIQSKNDIVNKAMSVKYNLNSKNKAQREEMNIFREKVDAEVVRQQEQTGKKVTNEELRVITNKLMTDVVVGPNMFFGDRTKPYFLAGEKISDVPKAEINLIREMLSREGIRPTESAILFRYNERLRQKMEGE